MVAVEVATEVEARFTRSLTSLRGIVGSVARKDTRPTRAGLQKVARAAKRKEKAAKVEKEAKEMEKVTITAREAQASTCRVLWRRHRLKRCTSTRAATVRQSCSATGVAQTPAVTFSQLDSWISHRQI